MKKIFSILFCLALVIPMPLMTGCQSTPQRTIYNMQLTTQTTVEGLLALWDMKVSQGGVSLDQERQVKKAVTKYRQSALLAHDLVDSYIRVSGIGTTAEPAQEARLKADAAAQEAVKALSALVQLLATYGVN